MTEKPHYEHNTGRWLCPDKTTAEKTAKEHPGEYVFTYKRDEQGNMKDITEYYNPRAPDKINISAIRGGRLRLKI